MKLLVVLGLGSALCFLYTCTLQSNWSSDQSRITAPPSVCCLSQAQGCGLHGNNIWKQPGPVEALKQMLFRLQAVEAELQRQQQPSVVPTLSNRLNTKETPEKQVWTVSQAKHSCAHQGSMFANILWKNVLSRVYTESPNTPTSGLCCQHSAVLWRATSQALLLL